MPPIAQGYTPIWVWLKMKQEGLCRFWSMFPLTRVPFWCRLFEPQPYFYGLISHSFQPSFLSQNRIRFPWDSEGVQERRIPGKNGKGRYPCTPRTFRYIFFRRGSRVVVPKVSVFQGARPKKKQLARRSTCTSERQVGNERTRKLRFPGWNFQ